MVLKEKLDKVLIRAKSQGCCYHGSLLQGVLNVGLRDLHGLSWGSEWRPLVPNRLNHAGTTTLVDSSD